MAAVLACATAASAVSVNGFAYHGGLGPYSEVGEFYDKGLGLPYARAIVAYDSADDPAEMAYIHGWVQRMQSRGRQVLISFNHNDSAPPDPAVYGPRITAFRDWMIDHGNPIPEFTAWNEPNLPAVNDRTGVRLNPSSAEQAALAARYWKRLNSLCQIAVNGQRCVAIAGDFSDPNPGIAGHVSFFNRYVADYIAELGSTAPAKWAIHPYSAIANKNFSVIERWINTSTGSVDVWLTELGAMYCRPDYGYTDIADDPNDTIDRPGTSTTGLTYQNDRVDGLKRSLAALPSRVTRAYYYTLSAPAAATHHHCDVDPSWDSQLLGDQYGYGSNERPAFRTLFPSAPTPQPPTASTTGGSDVTTTTATLNGQVNPRGLTTTYWFEYGKTNAYGATTPIRSVGAGSTVSEGVTGLIADTTYHYRVVASNVVGTTYGADQTFATRRGSLNGDALADLVIADPPTNAYAAALSDGFSFNGAGWWLSGWNGRPDFADLGDFNGDAKTDLIVGSQSTATYSVALSDGTRFGAPGTQQWLNGWAAGAVWARAGDFNGDGKSDLAVADPNSNTYSVALSDGTRLVSAGIWLAGWNGRPDFADVGDFNGDGLDDLIVGRQSTATYSVALSDGTRFGAPGTQQWLTGWGVGMTTEVGDFNGDGKSDLIVADGPSNAYAVALSDGSRLNGAGWWLNNWTGTPDFADAADFNGDGKDDLVLGITASATYAVALSTGTALGGPGTQNWLTGWAAGVWAAAG